MRLISNLTGRVAVAEEITRPSYWRRHVREAVRFGDGLQALQKRAAGLLHRDRPAPDPAARWPRRLSRRSQPRLIASLRRGKADWRQMLEGSVGGLSSRRKGGLARSERGGRDRIVDLPSYPFQRERYWFRARAAKPLAPSRPRERVPSAAGLRVCARRRRGAIYEAAIGADTPGFVRQHRVLDQVILPATAYLEMLARRRARRAANVMPSASRT